MLPLDLSKSQKRGLILKKKDFFFFFAKLKEKELEGFRLLSEF